MFVCVSLVPWRSVSESKDNRDCRSSTPPSTVSIYYIKIECFGIAFYLCAYKVRMGVVALAIVEKAVRPFSLYAHDFTHWMGVERRGQGLAGVVKITCAAKHHFRRWFWSFGVGRTPIVECSCSAFPIAHLRVKTHKKGYGVQNREGVGMGGRGGGKTTQRQWAGDKRII